MSTSKLINFQPIWVTHTWPGQAHTGSRQSAGSLLAKHIFASKHAYDSVYLYIITKLQSLIPLAT